MIMQRIGFILCTPKDACRVKRADRAKLTRFPGAIPVAFIGRGSLPFPASSAPMWMPRLRLSARLPVRLRDGDYTPQSGDKWGRYPCFAASARLMYRESDKVQPGSTPGRGFIKFLWGKIYGGVADRISAGGRAEAV